MNDNLARILLPLIILGTLSTCLIYFVRILTAYFLRKKMVDKGYVDKESVAILTKQQKGNNEMETLKWGLVVFFTGIALVILEFIDYTEDSPLPFGLVALSISIGLLLHFVISRNINKDIR